MGIFTLKLNFCWRVKNWHIWKVCRIFNLFVSLKTVVSGILKNEYSVYRTIVICDKDEIMEVNKWLVRKGIDTIALSDDSCVEEIQYCESEWSFMKGGQNKGELYLIQKPRTDELFQSFCALTLSLILCCP
mgnify:FL=1